METLKPCPFCGSVEDLTYMDDHCVDCLNCGASGPMADGQRSTAEEWNNRECEPDD